jgi:hypothetical protein
MPVTLKDLLTLWEMSFREYRIFPTVVEDSNFLLPIGSACIDLRRLSDHGIIAPGPGPIASAELKFAWDMPD